MSEMQPIVNEAKQVGADVQQAASDATTLVTDLKAEGHAILDSIKAATNQAQVHDLVAEAKAWVEKLFSKSTL